MRLFTAIEIPGEIKTRLEAFIDRLRPTAKLAWSPVENLHITTRFIGEWPEARLDEIPAALASLPPHGTDSGTIEIAIRGVGWFPGPRNPRVLFAGIEARPGLRALADETDRALTGLGIPAQDREFHPHLTLARRRSPVPVDKLLCALESAAAYEFGVFRATSFFLYLSAGGRYTKLQEFPLTRI
jgi:RNA 2',3'-cyclic 3'-phosphodiesterase